MTPEELKKQREELGLYQRELGEMLGYSATAIHYYESGKKPISKRFIVAFDMLMDKIKKN